MTSENPKTIMVVEDDLSLREIYSELLRHNNFEVVDFPDGPSAIAALQNGAVAPNLMVLDYLLPNNMNADLVVEQLENLPGLEKIPIILVSALGSETKEIGRLKSHPWVVASFNKGDITHQKVIDFVRAYFD